MAHSNSNVHDEHQLAMAIRSGAAHRPRQSFGAYFDSHGGSCALGAAYEGVYRLPEEVAGEIPHRLDRFFHCLENTSRRCPAGCKKQVPVGALIVHLNDDHHWTREMIATWLDGGEVVAPPGKEGGPDTNAAVPPASASPGSEVKDPPGGSNTPE